MIRLDSTLRKLQIVLAGAITTSQLPVTVSYADKTSSSYLGGETLSNTNSTTAVDICSAPAAGAVRDIDYISVRNSDTVAATATIRYNDNATLYTIITVLLAVGDVLKYSHASGWSTTDSNGSLKNLSPANYKLSAFAATTSAELATIISDETGSGLLVFGTSPTITTPAITGGTINNTTIGATTATTGAFTTLSATDLTTTGNTVLGDASTDTLNVGNGGLVKDTSGNVIIATGNVRIGAGSGPGDSALVINANSSGATNTFGIRLLQTIQSGVTAGYYGVISSSTTAASAFTLANVYLLYAGNMTKGAGSAITTQYGYFCEDLTSGTNNYGFYSNVSSGTNKWNFYANGTADNYFAGNVGIGGATYAGIKLSISGAASTTAAMRFYNNAATTNQFQIGQGLSSGTDNIGYMWNIANAALSLGTNNAEKLNISTSGEIVAINGTSDTAALAATIKIKSGTACGIGFPATQVASSDANTLDDYREQYSVTMTATGFTTSPTVLVDFVKVGSLVHVSSASLSATSNAATFTLGTGGVPAVFRPNTNRIFTCVVFDNGGANAMAVGWVDSAGTITLGKDLSGSGGGFTASGSKGMYNLNFCYHTNT